MGYKIIRPRRGIKSLWDAYKDKIYKTGEMLVESPESGVGTGPVNVKFGDGMTPYYALPYAIEAPINQAIEGSTKPITSGAVYELNSNLGGLRFGVNGEGNGGYFKADDCFVPFRKDPVKVDCKSDIVTLENLIPNTTYIFTYHGYSYADNSVCKPLDFTDASIVFQHTAINSSNFVGFALFTPNNSTVKVTNNMSSKIPGYPIFDYYCL